eukprot:Gb_20994 [translate_table: standard]
MCRMRKALYGLKQGLRAWYIISLTNSWENRGSSGLLQIPIQSSMGRPGMLSFIATSSDSWLRMEAESCNIVRQRTKLQTFLPSFWVLTNMSNFGTSFM